MGTPLLWIGFNVFILACIALDLGVFNQRLHKVSLREAGFFSLLWVALSILFGLGIVHYSGKQAGLEFFTGYLIEKALSVDNLFLFLVIFRTFAVDERFQHRMLEWGILGALVMRGMMILAGAELIQRFSWVLYVFGAFIVYAGIHMLFVKKEKVHPEKSLIFRFASKHLRVARDYGGEHFFSCCWSSKSRILRWLSILSPRSSASRRTPSSFTLPTFSRFWACVPCISYWRGCCRVCAT